jgi:hypothetical protein
MSSTKIPPQEGSPTDLLELLPAIPVCGSDRLAWLDRLADIVAEDVANIGVTLVEDGWGAAAAREAITDFGAYLAARIVAIVAAVADEPVRVDGRDPVRP